MYSQTVTPTNTPQEWAPASGARSRRISVPYGRARPRAPRGVCSSVPRPSLGSSTGTHAALRRCRVPWSISIASRRVPDPVVPALGDDSRSGTGARRRWGVRLPQLAREADIRDDSAQDAPAPSAPGRGARLPVVGPGTGRRRKSTTRASSSRRRRRTCPPTKFCTSFTRNSLRRIFRLRSPYCTPQSERDCTAPRTPPPDRSGSGVPAGVAGLAARPIAVG